MRQKKGVEWTRLDNASKFFPSTYNDKDTKVFRLSCELKEAVDPNILQQALDITLEAFPLYKSVLRRGVFWYYLETSDIRPVVEIESNPVCAPIYIKNRRNLLFRVFYFNTRINLEIFHALSDGTGALWFLQTLVYHYLVLKHKDRFADNKPKLSYNAPVSQKMDDSFRRYFAGEPIHKQLFSDDKEINRSRAYHIKGTPMDENRMKLIEGAMPVKAVLDMAHEYNTTLTIFTAALFMLSIYKEMPVPLKKHPVVLSVPINLRQFFESVTTRNFFSTMNIGYDFGTGSPDLEAIIRSISESFRRELTEEQMSRRLNRLISLEKNIFTRIAPLPLKDYSIRLANKLNDRKITASISNIGRIVMPSEFDIYIRQFSICTSARRPQICMCSYGGRMVISFTSPYRDTDIQRNFFQFLSRKGIEVEVSSNI